MVGGVLAWGAVISAGAAITRASAPETALRFDGDDPEALARLAERALLSGDPAAVPRAESLSLRAISEQPLNPIALRVLGFVREASGRKANAGALIRTAQAMSRRDVPAQLWLIEDAVSRSNIPQALSHYDIALRVSPSARSLLFPVLTGALTEPEIRQGMGRFLRSPPDWLLGFLYHAIDLGERPQDVAAMLIGAGGLPGRPDFRVLQPRLLERLEATREYQALRGYYESLPRADRGRLTRADLSPSSFAPDMRPVAWELPQDVSFGTTRDGQRGGLQAFAEPGVRGLVARRILFLRPGDYRFRSAQRAAGGGQGDGAWWTLNCLTSAGGTPVWRSPDLTAGPVDTSVAIRASDACAAYALELEIAGGQSQSGLNLAVDRMSFKREPGGQ